MNITMVLGNDFLRPYVDGRVYREARSLVRAGHKVTIVCWARTITNEILSGVPAEEEYEGIRVKRVFSPIAPLTSPSSIRIYQHFRAMHAIAKAISKLRTDALHCHDFNTLFTLLFLRNFDKPVVYDSHEDFINMVDEVVPGPMLWFARKIERFMLGKYVDYAISVCEPIIQSLKHYGVENTEMVMNCRDLDDYSSVPQSTISELRHKLVKKDELMVLYIGSIGNDRGLKDLVEIYRGEDKILDRSILVLGGMGYLEDRLKACIKGMSNVEWVGYVPGRQLVEYNLASDIMVVLFNPAKRSQRVCLPNKLFEAMSAGKPIIVCKGTEAAKLVEKEDCGLIVPYGNRSALKSAISSLIEDSSRRAKLGRNGRLAAKRLYNWRVQERRLIGIYNNITQSYNIS